MNNKEINNEMNNELLLNKEQLNILKYKQGKYDNDELLILKKNIKMMVIYNVDKTIAQILSVIDSGNFLNRLESFIKYKTLNELKDYSVYFNDILSINFVDGPENVRNRTKLILKNMVDNRDIYPILLINNVLLTMYKSLIILFGEWVSSFNPKNGLLIAKMIEEILNNINMNTNTYYKLLEIYNLLSIDNRNIIEDTDGMFIVFNNISKSLINISNNKILNNYNNNIKKAIKVINIIFPLTFSISVINECCILCKE